MKDQKSARKFGKDDMRHFVLNSTIHLTGQGSAGGDKNNLHAPVGRAPATAVPATVTRRVFHGHDELIMLRLADGTEALSRALDGTAPVGVGDPCAVWVRGPVRAWPRPADPDDQPNNDHGVVVPSRPPEGATTQ